MSTFYWPTRSSSRDQSCISTVGFKPSAVAVVVSERISEVRSTLFCLDIENHSTIEFEPGVPAFGVTKWSCGKSKPPQSELFIRLDGSVFRKDWSDPIFDEFVIYKGLGVTNLFDYHQIFMWRSRYWTIADTTSQFSDRTCGVARCWWLTKVSISKN